METTIMENQMENKMDTREYVGVIILGLYMAIMENIMETTMVCWGYIGVMENETETTIQYWGI